LEKVDWWNPIRTSAIQPRSRTCSFWAFPIMKRELQGKFQSDERSAAHFQEVGGVL
jgi:hypothetical protein